MAHSGSRRAIAPLLRSATRRGLVLGLGLALAGFRPAVAAEPLVPDARSGTFTGSTGGFFVCTVTPTSPVDTPDCFLGYVVPEGQAGHGRVRAVAGGFQRSSNFPVLEEVSADSGAFAIGDQSAIVDVNFPDLGRLQVRLVAGTGGPGWANSACPKTVLAYALAAGGSTVYPVAQARGTLSRNRAWEDVALYEPPSPVGCFAYFTGRGSGAWRISQPHSAGHRRFDPPPPIPSTGPGSTASPRSPQPGPG